MSCKRVRTSACVRASIPRACERVYSLVLTWEIATWETATIFTHLPQPDSEAPALVAVPML